MIKWIVDNKDWIAIVTSIVALLMPLWQFIIKRFFFPLKLEIIPFRGIDLLFNESGSYLKARFSLSCKNKELTIHKVWLNITNNSIHGSETLTLDWQFFEPYVLQWYGSNMANSLNSTAYARPIKVNSNSVEPLLIEFSNNNVDRINALQTVNDRRAKAISECIEAVKDPEGKFSIKAVCELLKRESEYSQLLLEYSKYFFWKQGDYTITFNIDYDGEKTFSKSYKFSLAQDEAKRLENNIEETIFCRLYKSYDFPTQFNSLHKDLKTIE